jgi:A/G-specific adenine glycosylase
VAQECAWHLAGHPEPDPATGSAAVSRRQARFEGSARQARGRVMARLATGPMSEAEVPALVGWTGRDHGDTESASLVDGLVADGLVERCDDGRLRLPR